MSRKGVSINYPSNRKSPVVHDVTGYTKSDGTRVSGYVRGRRQGIPLHKGKVVKGKTFNDDTEGPPEAWDVTFKYRGGGKETVTVIAPSYEKAMDEAFEERKRQTEKPFSIEIVDPGLWGAISGVLRGAGKRAKFTVKKHVIMGLVKDAYSDDKVKRVGARIALKQTHPEIFNLCDFSREKRVG